MAPPSIAHWNMHNLHEVVISAASKEDKIAAYDSWASKFDADLASHDAHVYRVSGTRLFNLVRTTCAPNTIPIIVDVGCGTGGPAKVFHKLVDDAQIRVRLIGYDFSEGMLEQARHKAVFNELFVADVFADVPPVRDSSVDYVICIGLFAGEQCSLAAVPRLVAHLRRGGHALISFRCNVYERDGEHFRRLIHDSGCEVVDVAEDEYLGPVNAIYITVRKM